METPAEKDAGCFVVGALLAKREVIELGEKIVEEAFAAFLAVGGVFVGAVIAVVQGRTVTVNGRGVNGREVIAWAVAVAAIAVAVEVQEAILTVDVAVIDDGHVVDGEVFVAGVTAEVEFVVAIGAVGVSVDEVAILLQDAGIAAGAGKVVAIAGGAIAGGADEKIGGVEIVSASRAEDRGREIDLGAELLARSQLNH